MGGQGPLHDGIRAVHNVFLMVWIIAAVVITNSYKAIMKSNYSFDPTYKSPWTSIKEMKNFAFIFPLREGSDEDFTFRFQNAMKTLCSHVLRENLYRDPCVHENEILFLKPRWETFCLGCYGYHCTSPICHFAEELWGTLGQQRRNVMPSGNSNMDKWLESWADFVSNTMAKPRVRRIEQLETVIREELLQPQTVYVTASENFDEDWKVFKKVMRTLPSEVGFAGGDRDRSFLVKHKLQVENGYDRETFGDFMWFRALAMMESGIFEIWTKWDEMRKALMDGRKPVDADFVPLSFEHSDIHLHFWLWTGCLITSFLVLVAEIVVHTCRTTLIARIVSSRE